MKKKVSHAKFSWLLISTIAIVGCISNNIISPNNSLDETLSASPLPPPMVTIKPSVAKTRVKGLAVYTLWVNQDPVVAQIFLKSLETGEIKQLTHSGSNNQPVWSPDGSQILYQTWTKENSFDISIMDKDGKNQQLVISDSASEMNAKWSPDGKKIAFDSDEDGKYEIYIMDLQSREKVKLTNSSTGSNRSPDWSPDGKSITFVSSAGSSGKSQLFIVNVNGTNLIPLTDPEINYDDGPVWCPDASCILFTRIMGAPTKIMLFDLNNRIVLPLLGDVFEPDDMEFSLERSVLRNYITFYVDGNFHAMNMSNGEIYPLGIQAKDLSLYP